MSQKVQLRGNCQCCGRDHAVVGNTMSKHGYTVEQGWFQGVCNGEVYQPLQNDRSQTDRIIASVRAEVEELKIKVQKLESGEIHPLEIRRCSRRRDESEFISWEEASPYQRESGVKSAIWNTQNRIKAGESFADGMEVLANKVHGQPLREVAVESKRQVEVGSQVKVCGQVVTVTKIDYRICRGVGPSINGNNVEHVFWDVNGKEYAYPKRFARLV